MKKLRLLVTDQCNRDCQKCCNKQYDLGSLPICVNYTKYKEIIITGGEPMLYQDKLRKVIFEIQRRTDVPIYLYTAWNKDWKDLYAILKIVDGITLTLHSQEDVLNFTVLHSALNCNPNLGQSVSLRLNVFNGIKIPEYSFSFWKIKDNLIWIDDCPIPENEEFMRYE